MIAKLNTRTTSVVGAIIFTLGLVADPTFQHALVGAFPSVAPYLPKVDQFVQLGFIILGALGLYQGRPAATQPKGP